MEMGRVRVGFGFACDLIDYYPHSPYKIDYDTLDNYTMIVDVIAPVNKLSKIKAIYHESLRQREKAEAMRKYRTHRYFYFTNHDIEAMTAKGILIRLNNQVKFWFPKHYVSTEKNYYEGFIPRWLENELKKAGTPYSLSKYDIWQALGNPKRVAENTEPVALYEDHHVPPKLKPKEVSADDRLKR